jgi:hypothetical protein
MGNKKLIIGTLFLLMFTLTHGPSLATSKKPTYTIKTNLADMYVGSSTVATLRIIPEKGFKFNKKYPSKFRVVNTQQVKCDKHTLTKAAGDVKTSGRIGLVSIPLDAIATGTSNVAITGTFNICNSSMCYILRGETLSLTVVVKNEN